MNIVIGLFGVAVAIWGLWQIGWEGGTSGAPQSVGYLNVPIIQETPAETDRKNAPARNRTIGDRVVFGLAAGVVILLVVMAFQ
jgi:hypothetical protein